MKNIRLSLFVGMIASLCALSACKQEKQTPLVPLDLTLYELPITIQAPAEADIKNTKIGYIQDLSVVKGKDYNVQIFASDVRTNNIENIKQELIEEVKAQIYFTDMIKDFPDGFIYKTAVDSTESFGFRHIVIRGDHEIIFQQGLAGNFPLESVITMHESVQQK